MGISSVSGKISAETALIQSWFFLLWIFGFLALFQRKSALFSSVSEKISAETALIQRWFFCSENFEFQSCFRENQRCSALNQLCFRENQRCSALNQLCFRKNQRCSALNQLGFRENQRWNSTDSELIFLLWIFGFLALFQRKSALFSSVSEKISAETALIQRWFLALKISVFSAVQIFSGNEQRWNRLESILNQRCSEIFR